MDGVRKIATRMTVLHVTDNKANKVSRGRTTKLVKSCKECSGRLVKRHCWFGKSTDDAVWFKDSFACNKQSKHSSTLFDQRESYRMLHSKEFLFFFFFNLFITFYWAGFYSCPEGKGTRGLQGPIQRCPTSPTPPIRIRKTATAPGSPYSFRIVRGFFYVPQNYQHSRTCGTGPPTYRPYPRMQSFPLVNPAPGPLLSRPADRGLFWLN